MRHFPRGSAPNIRVEFINNLAVPKAPGDPTVIEIWLMRPDGSVAVDGAPMVQTLDGTGVHILGLFDFRYQTSADDQIGTWTYQIDTVDIQGKREHGPNRIAWVLK